jgi:putative Holliday junction resolvase
VPVIDVTDLAAALAGGKTLAGLDLGEKTIGVAVSDRGLSFAHPRPVIVRRKFTLDAKALLDLVAKENVGAVVMGLPVNMDGTEGPRAQSARALVRNILERRDVPLALWDERLSTAGAERALPEADTSRARRDELIDKLAAAWILQGAIDRLNQAI